jgi:hypothetical protein
MQASARPLVRSGARLLSTVATRTAPVAALRTTGAARAPIFAMAATRMPAMNLTSSGVSTPPRPSALTAQHLYSLLRLGMGEWERLAFGEEASVEDPVPWSKVLQGISAHSEQCLGVRASRRACS